MSKEIFTTEELEQIENKLQNRSLSKLSDELKEIFKHFTDYPPKSVQDLNKNVAQVLSKWCSKVFVSDDKIKATMEQLSSIEEHKNES